MSLHIEVSGQGQPLVMLHGWGMHGGVWGEVAAKLAEDFAVHCVDLPGYGKSLGREKGEPFPLSPSSFSLDYMVDELLAAFPEPISLCGWSLGGIIALRWATREPQKIKHLILVNSTPCFANRDGWELGMPHDILQQFADELENNHAATLRRFLALQVRGSEDERELLSVLREKLFSRGEPELDALRTGLNILRDADLRGVLPHIRQPTLVIAGERDKLTPPQASRYMARVMPNAGVVEIKGAAHAPFLSHHDFFVETIKNFLTGNPQRDA